MFGLRNYIHKFSDNNCENILEEEEIFQLENYDIGPFLPLLNDVITLAFQVCFYVHFNIATTHCYIANSIWWNG